MEAQLASTAQPFFYLFDIIFGDFSAGSVKGVRKLVGSDFSLKKTYWKQEKRDVDEMKEKPSGIKNRWTTNVDKGR